MTERQEKVLNYIFEKGKVGIRELGRECGFNVNESKNNHDCCTALRNEINAINTSKENDCVIMFDEDYNYWVERDFKVAFDFMKEKKFIPAIKKLRTWYAVLKKLKPNGQLSFEEYIIAELKGE